jgi:hypothetical protein
MDDGAAASHSGHEFVRDGTPFTSSNIQRSMLRRSRICTAEPKVRHNRIPGGPGAARSARPDHTCPVQPVAIVHPDQSSSVGDLDHLEPREIHLAKSHELFTSRAEGFVMTPGRPVFSRFPDADDGPLEWLIDTLHKLRRYPARLFTRRSNPLMHCAAPLLGISSHNSRTAGAGGECPTRGKSPRTAHALRRYACVLQLHGQPTRVAPAEYTTRFNVARPCANRQASMIELFYAHPCLGAHVRRHHACGNRRARSHVNDCRKVISGDLGFEVDTWLFITRRRHPKRVRWTTAAHDDDVDGT